MTLEITSARPITGRPSGCVPKVASEIRSCTSSCGWSSYIAISSSTTSRSASSSAKAGAKTISPITSSATSSLLVGHARVDDGVLARGGGVQLAAEAVEGLGDLLRAVAGRALEEQVLDEVRDARLRVGLVAGARADPEADRDRAHVREALRDDALARVQLREHVLLLHGRIVLARTAARLAAWSSRTRWRRRSRRCRTTCARRCRTSAIVVEDEPPAGEPLLGLYEGIPLTARSSYYAGAAPDKISIYRGPLERLYGHDPNCCSSRSAAWCCTRSRTTSGSATSGWSSSTATERAPRRSRPSSLPTRARAPARPPSACRRSGRRAPSACP